MQKRLFVLGVVVSLLSSAAVFCMEDKEQKRQEAASRRLLEDLLRAGDEEARAIYKRIRKRDGSKTDRAFRVAYRQGIASEEREANPNPVVSRQLF